MSGETYTCECGAVVSEADARCDLCPECMALVEAEAREANDRPHPWKPFRVTYQGNRPQELAYALVAAVDAEACKQAMPGARIIAVATLDPRSRHTYTGPVGCDDWGSEVMTLDQAIRACAVVMDLDRAAPAHELEYVDPWPAEGDLSRAARG